MKTEVVDDVKCPVCKVTIGVPNHIDAYCPKCRTTFQWEQIGDPESDDPDKRYDMLLWGAPPRQAPVNTDT